MTFAINEILSDKTVIGTKNTNKTSKFSKKF